MLEIVINPFVQKRAYGGALLSAWSCNMLDKEGKACKRVELSKAKILLHIAVEHGVRMIKQQKDNT